MLFNSFPFIVFVLIAFSLYYIPALNKYQVKILILSSLFFYAYNNPSLLLLLLTSAGINILTSYYVVYGRAGNRKMLALLGVVANILILSFFKYGSLLSRTFFDPNGTIGTFLLTIPLPIGISFYTFEGISLLVDVYRKDDKRDTEIVAPSLAEHINKTILFISFFPHLIAGPILKAHDFLPQVKIKFFKDIAWEIAFKNIVLGYFLKMVVADNLKNLTYWISYPFFQNYTCITLVTMLFGYSCQIFADFAGYSLIAIGIARLFGYNFKDNFYFPYIASSFKEFWKRWHISLSSFLMEYLYIPLGGNRKGKIRTYINLMITMLLGGLWHGAAWSYAVWGGFHGLALAVERFFTSARASKKNIFVITLQRIVVFVFVTLAWLLFKLPQFNYVIAYFKAIMNNTSLYYDDKICNGIIIYSTPVFMYHAFYLIREKPVYAYIKKTEYVLYAILLFLILTNSGTSGSFIYFQF